MWTSKQMEESFQHYWMAGRASCPSCKGELEFSVENVIGNALINAWCARCEESALLNLAQEQKLMRWRSWTDLELCVLVDDHYNGRTSSCPVCATPVKVHHEPAAKGDRLTFHCRRCGNKVSG